MVCELRAYVESAYNLSAKVVISSEMRYTFSRNHYLLHLVAVDAEGCHQAITEEFLLKTASHDRLHGERVMSCAELHCLCRPWGDWYKVL